jgi:hypothetical protein
MNLFILVILIVYKISIIFVGLINKRIIFQILIHFVQQKQIFQNFKYKLKFTISRIFYSLKNFFKQ